MLKKLTMLISLFFLSETPAQADIGDMAGMAAAATVASVVTGTAVYMATRESNDAMMQRIDSLCDFYAGNLNSALLHIATLSDMKKFISQSAQFKKEIVVFHGLVSKAYLDMSVRYASWLNSPLNWTSDMKAAYATIRELHQKMICVMIMFRYQPLISEWSENMSDVVVVKQVKLMCQGASSYPLCMSANMLREDIQLVSNTRLRISCDLVLIDMMEKLLVMVQGSAGYVEERRIQDEIALKQRMVLIEQAKADEQSRANAKKERS